MANIFHEFYNQLKESEKEFLISKSGSSSKDKYEKIRSGQSYLYKKQGMESEVIEIRFDKKISSSSLTSAVSTTGEKVATGSKTNGYFLVC